MVKETSTREGSTKKKRKNVSTIESEDVDIYKKVVEFEEKEALSRSADTDANIYIDICQSIRESLGEIVHLKAQNSPDAKLSTSQKCTDACVKIAVLKKLNRMEKVRLVSAKEALIVEKQKVDSINLQYQNLLYEANHLISEFNKCFQFKSKDEDIDLVSVNEFLADAPESVTRKFKDYDAEDETVKHELRLARLEWELQQRKNLAKLCKTLEEEKKKIGLDIIERRKKLDGLAPRLTAVLEATKPLQEYLNLPVDKLRAEHKLASLLPDSLYLFYVNVDAYKQVYDLGMTIAIIGDQEEAAQWKTLQNSSNLQEEEDSEPEIEQDSEEIVEVKKRRHRKSIKVDPMEEKKKKLVEVHPLLIEVSLPMADGLCLKMQLCYYTHLKIIGVKSDVAIPSKITGYTAKEVLFGENLLGELIPGDFGTESPNPCTSVQFKKVGLGSYESLIPELGYAYAWAQRVCGLDFLTDQSSQGQANRLSQTNVELVMKTLHRRLQSRYALAVQLELLEQNQIPKIPDKVDVPKNMTSCLTKWSTKTYHQFSQLPCAELLVEGEIVKDTDVFYCASISRSNATLEAYIVIKNNFPIQPPLFTLMLNYNGKHHSGNNDDIRDIERSLNVGWNRGFGSADWILAAQITHACSYLDVLLETVYPETFPQSSMFFRSKSARNRRRPFRFRKIGSGIFTQY